MPNLIQAVFLNDLVIILVMGMALAALTSWAFRMGEYTGYTLGWMIGVFFVVVFSSMIMPSAMDNADNSDYARLSLLTVIFAALMGFVTSLVLMTAVQLLISFTRTSLQTWLIVIGVGLVISSGYLMLITSDAFRLMIAIFVLALAIMMLLVRLFYPRRYYAPAETDLLPADPLAAPPTLVDPLRPLQQAFPPESARDPLL